MFITHHLYPCTTQDGTTQDTQHGVVATEPAVISQLLALQPREGASFPALLSVVDSADQRRVTAVHTPPARPPPPTSLPLASSLSTLYDQQPVKKKLKK